MTREDARKAAEIMLAYANGKKIESKLKSMDENLYHPSTDLLFNWEGCDYKIKSEPKYRPFYNAEECWNEMQKHLPFGWVCVGEEKMLVTDVHWEGIIDGRNDGWVFSEAFSRYTFVDGESFGVKEEEE